MADKQNIYYLEGAILGGRTPVVMPTGYYVVERGTIRPGDKCVKGGKSHLRFGGTAEWRSVDPLFYDDEIDEGMLLIRPVASPN